MNSGTLFTIQDLTPILSLSKGKNINKTNKHPKKYFSDIPQKEIDNAVINTDLLDYRRYNKFLEERSSKILTKLTKETGLSEKDFNCLYE